ncbi:hypothetical protein J5N97_009766 [Dioscorea zingiberensis]|uniref:Protein CHROMATIN REMODELING 25 n=1 Tax=Dioscorea zingiberensis TaxID=325984 RepID=A0A9D5HM74_9LILI|nr:hypothetical protein J5N97_009766 [Dioscorea zingiberensis]
MASREEECDFEDKLSSDSEEDDSHEYDADPESPLSEEELKSKNVADLVRGNLVVRRQPLIPRVLSVSDGAAVARKPFKPPRSKRYSDHNDELSRRLLVRKRFVPWGSTRPVLVTLDNLVNTPKVFENVLPETKPSLPPGIEPLVLWEPEGPDEENEHLTRIEVDPLLVCYLRPHQREGVQFMFECVSGISSTDGISGCILADDMGLGKTLQSITLLYTLLCQGFDGKPMVKRALIVTPTSLVSNWESEIYKWVGRRIQLLSLCESTRADVVSGIDSFLGPSTPFQVLIISYETFRMHSSKFERSGSCDLLICDEAHRLKNDQTRTNQALAALPCSRRILLSGTPMQNDLEEFFAMVNFTNPGILGDASYFRRYYEAPIIAGREPMSTKEEKELGTERSAELSARVNQFVLRRTNALLSNHLPPKIVEVVCCKMTTLQQELYKHFIQKLCNHPKLIYDTIKSGSPCTSGFEDCIRFFPRRAFLLKVGFNSITCYSVFLSGSWTGGGGIWVELSSKMHVLARLLGHLRQKTDDRIVLVSNYTQTLDLFAQLCRERRYPYLRLDGTTSIGKRQKLVNRFNDLSKTTFVDRIEPTYCGDEFVFLLSSKAGGCGLNLIGGNRLVLFDPDWNPANDKQAAARVWRDGQKKRVYQRQMSKEGLQKVIQHEKADNIRGNFLSMEDLRDLFSFHEDVRSEIHENMNCNRCKINNIVQENNILNESKTAEDTDSTDEGQLNQLVDIGGFAEIAGCLHKLRSSEKQLGSPLEEDLASWAHHFTPSTVPDLILQASAGDEVSFVFTNQVDGKLIPVESERRSANQQIDVEKHHSQKGKLLSSQLAQSLMPNVNGSQGLRTPPLKGTLKSLKTSLNVFHVPKKLNSSPGEQSSLKRMPVKSNLSDDDFL